MTDRTRAVAAVETVALSHETSWPQLLDRDALLMRSKQPLSALPRPFLRWAGSKAKLLSHLVGWLPGTVQTYYEPFFGSGALFFLLEPRNAVISDKATDLHRTYVAVRDNPRAVHAYLKPLDPLSKAEYYRVREDRAKGPYKWAAEFIFLNRACWNGLYRVNREGKFNVPYGAPKTANLPSLLQLEAASAALARPGVVLENCDYSTFLDSPGEGDVVFLDPPYVTGHNNNGFVDYNETLFSWHDQEQLAKHAVAIAGRGATVLVTNAYHQPIIDLYPGFSAVEISRPSTLAGRASARGQVSEVLLVGGRHG